MTTTKRVGAARIALIASVVAAIAIVIVALTVNRPTKAQVVKDCVAIHTPQRAGLTDAQFADILRACEANR